MFYWSGGPGPDPRSAAVLIKIRLWTGDGTERTLSGRRIRGATLVTGVTIGLDVRSNWMCRRIERKCREIGGVRLLRPSNGRGENARSEAVLERGRAEWGAAFGSLDEGAYFWQRRRVMTAIAVPYCWW